MIIITKIVRKSVPTGDLNRWYAVGWAYIMPDFDIPDYSKIEWLSDKAPVEPDHRVPSTQSGSAG